MSAQDGSEKPLSLRASVTRGDRFVLGKRTYRFHSTVGEDWILEDGDDVLKVPRIVDGLPGYPTERDMRRMLATKELVRRSEPLAIPARSRARAMERSKAEVLKADPVAQLRWDVCHWMDSERPVRDDASLEAAFKGKFDVEEVKDAYGFVPRPSTIREWADTRGRPNERRWCDMEDVQGQGERSKRVLGERFEIALWHATRIFSKKGARLSPAAAHRALKRDMNRLNAGKALKADKFVPMRFKPEAPIKPMDRTTFYKLAHRLESARNETSRLTQAAVRSRREGGGRSIEAVRFLQLVQMDETDVSAFFFVDERRRVPLGCAVSTIAVDCATTAIVGWDLSWEAGSVSSWMRTVLHMGSLKAVPEEFRADFGDLDLLGGVASAMIFDNAFHYAGLAVRDAGGDLVMDVLLSGEGEPTHKGLVERTHASVFEIVTRLIPARKVPIAIAREWNIDLAAFTACDLGQFRKRFARAVAIHNTTPTKALADRSPLQAARKDQARYGQQFPADIDQFERTIANVSYSRMLDKSGIVFAGLRYSSKRGTKNLLDDFIFASADRRRTKNPTFPAKIKIYEHDLSRISIFNPKSGRYEDLECTKPLYAAGLSLQLHRIIQAGFGARGIDGMNEEALLEARGRVEDAVEADFPEAFAREEAAHAAILSDARTIAIASDRAAPSFVAPSRTGREAVARDLGIGTRHDAMIKPPGGRRGDDDPLGDDADQRTPTDDPAHQAQTDRDEAETSGTASVVASAPKAAPARPGSAEDVYGDFDL